MMEKFKVTPLSRVSLHPVLTPGVREERNWPEIAQAYVELGRGAGMVGWGCTGTGGWGGTRTKPQLALNTAEELRQLLNGALQLFIKITAGPPPWVSESSGLRTEHLH